MNTLAQETEQARIIVHNLQEPRNVARLQNFGFGSPWWQQGASLLDQLLLLRQTQQDGYQAKGNVGRSLRADAQEMHRRFIEHRTLAKWVLRNDADEYQRLGLHQTVSNRIVTKIEQAQRFYYEALKSPRALVRHGITKAELEQAQAMVEAVVEARHRRVHKSGLAQDATQQRDEVRQALRTWVSDVRAIARIALREEPQLLEVLGLSSIRLKVTPSTLPLPQEGTPAPSDPVMSTENSPVVN